MTSHKNIATPEHGQGISACSAHHAAYVQAHTDMHSSSTEGRTPSVLRPQWQWMSPRVKACLERLQQAIAAERQHMLQGPAVWAALQRPAAGMPHRE